MAQNLHPGGTRGPFTYNFESLTSDDIKVSVEGNLKSTSTYDLVYNSDTGGTVTFKNDQPVPPSGADKVRIFRQTSGSTLKHEFQAGSSIRANDLNINDRQALYVAQENRESLNNLALGGASGVGITINGSHIEDGSIDSDKIANFQVKDVDLSSSTGTDSDRAVTTDHIRDDAVTTDKLANSINTTIAGKANTGANLSTFTNDTNYITLAQVPASFVTGMIMMFTGSTAPSGWALCDGNNGTPDLRNRFIVGAGSTYNVDDTGGANQVTLALNQIPAHTHTWIRQDAVTDVGYRPWPANNNDCKATTVNTGSAGGGQSHENRPPYYALSYIMKL